MAKHEIAYEETDKIESGWVKDPLDSGGETWDGISRVNNPNWEGWLIIDALKKLNTFPDNLKKNDSLQKMKREFYKKNYWDVYLADQIKDQKIANELYDTGVNCGTSVAATFLQRALNVTNRNQLDYPDLKVDGEIGNKTITALNNHPRPSQVLKVLNVLQGAKYIAICEAKQNQERFMSSWLSRVTLN